MKNSSQNDDCMLESHYDQLEPGQLQCHVEALFRRLWQFSVQDFVPSFFLPSVRVAVWSFETFPRYSQTFLRRTYSDYRKLFDSRSEPSNTRREIRNALVYSFALLYAVSSHGSWSADWVFPTITDDD